LHSANSFRAANWHSIRFSHEALLGVKYSRGDARHRLRRDELPNTSPREIYAVTEDLTLFPTDLVEQVFASLRISNVVHTGYAQLLLLLAGRASHAAPSRPPPLYGIETRQYPTYFDRGVWRVEVPTLTRDDLETTRDVAKKLLSVKNGSLVIAARRLNDSHLRDRIDDAVIDALIGLETLLGDDSPQEMTHKLAMRVAALARLRPDAARPNAVAVFKEVKKIYEYRSKIVHGKLDSAAKTVNNAFGGDKRGPLLAALKHLRNAIVALLNHPEFRSPTVIDEQILLGGDSSQWWRSAVPGAGGAMVGSRHSSFCRRAVMYKTWTRSCSTTASRPHDAVALPESPRTAATLLYPKDRYLATLGNGAVEANTLYTLRIHLSHACRILGTGSPVAELSVAALQGYVDTQAGEGVGANTIRKEVRTLRAAKAGAGRARSGGRDDRAVPGVAQGVPGPPIDAVGDVPHRPVAEQAVQPRRVRRPEG
jgi:hypothetical protein